MKFYEFRSKANRLSHLECLEYVGILDMQYFDSDYILVMNQFS